MEQKCVTIAVTVEMVGQLADLERLATVTFYLCDTITKKINSVIDAP